MAAGDITSERATSSDFIGAYFDGVDDKITLSSNPINQEDCTFSFLCNIFRGGNSTGRVFDNGRLFIYFNTATMKFVFSNDGAVTSAQNTTALNYNTWYHVVILRYGTNASFYINGVDEGAGVAVGNKADGTTAGIFGNSGTLARPYAGIIKNFKIFKRQLTTAEITSLYNGNELSGMSNHWMFNENLIDNIAGINGTATGAFINNTLSTRLTLDAKQMSLTAVTDKLIVLPVKGRDQRVAIIGANRATA